MTSDKYTQKNIDNKIPTTFQTFGSQQNFTFESDQIANGDSNKF